MFLVAINIGGAFIDFFDMASGTIFVDGFGNVLRFIKMPEFIVIILANGIGGGIQTVATFIPIVFFLYLFLTLLESTGYMVRVAFITERFMRWAGLPGKSFMSLSVGFGCSVPAIMSTRTIESLKHRIIVILMLPFMSCGAKLPVYVLFAAAFFPHNGQNIIFLLYLIGISLAVITGFIMRKAVLKTEAGNMLLDLPPYHVPNIKNILINSWNKVKIFIFGAGKILVPLVMVLVVLNSIGTNGTFKANNKNSLLAEIGKTIVPVFKPIGITDNNWQATVGIFTGMLAKEALIGTLDALYGADGKNDDEEFDLLQNIIDAFKTIPENLFSLKFSDPVGIAVGDLSNIEEVAADQEVQISTFKSMHNKFDGKIGAFAYLLFILLYAPCSAALSAAFKEIGTKWTLFMALWSTALAYSVSVIFYQTATFFSHPTYSSISIILSIAMMVGIVLYMSRKNSISEMIPLNKSSGCYS